MSRQLFREIGIDSRMEEILQIDSYYH
jgi:hypothetical protein